MTGRRGQEPTPFANHALVTPWISTTEPLAPDAGPNECQQVAMNRSISEHDTGSIGSFALAIGATRKQFIHETHASI